MKRISRRILKEPPIQKLPPEMEEAIAYVMSFPPLPYVAPKEYVYVTKSDFGYKIGRTTRPTRRPLSVAGNMPIKLEVMIIIEVPDSVKAEKRIHSQFFNKRLRGEWFALDDNDIELIKGFPDSFKDIPVDDDIPF